MAANPYARTFTLDEDSIRELEWLEENAAGKNKSQIIRELLRKEYVARKAEN